MSRTPLWPFLISVRLVRPHTIIDSKVDQGPLLLHVCPSDGGALGARYHLRPRASQGPTKYIYLVITVPPLHTSDVDSWICPKSTPLTFASSYLLPGISISCQPRGLFGFNF
jgi:hypothetical protein